MRTACSLAVAATLVLGTLGWSLGSQDTPPHDAVPPSPYPSNRADSEPVSIAPYWVDLGSQHARLAWRTREVSGGTFTWTNLDTGESESVSLLEGVQHQVLLEGLQPDQDYAWTLSQGRYGRWRTAPLAPQRSFAIVGHTHGSEHFGAYSDGLLAARIAESQPHFVVHCGDAVYTSTPADWKRHFFDLFRSTLQSAPIYVAPGNHDSGWPFVDGVDLRPFRELFPHDYPPAVPSQVGAAYYDVVQGPLHLLFLSYVSPLGPGSAQRAWIEQTLQRSEADFRVLVYGGFNQYYDREEWEAFLPTLPIDAVFRGDGTAPANARSMLGDLPVFSLGTRNQQPHPWIDARVQPEYLVLREMDAAGTAGEVHWIHYGQARPAVKTLQPTSREEDRKGVTWTFAFAEPWPASTQIRGLQFRIEGLADQKAYYYVSAVPAEASLQREGGFRSQYGLLEAKDRFGSAPLPDQRPVTGGAYGIRKIVLRVVTARPASELQLLSARLY